MIDRPTCRPARPWTCCRRSPAAEIGPAPVLAFVAVVFLVIALVHLYLWKRLVRDPLRPGWVRRAGGLAVVLLAVLVPATLIGTRTGAAKWLAWPGYLWIALMFYLLVALIVLEVPRLVLALLGRA